MGHFSFHALVISTASQKWMHGIIFFPAHGGGKKSDSDLIACLDVEAASVLVEVGRAKHRPAGC